LRRFTLCLTLIAALTGLTPGVTAAPPRIVAVGAFTAILTRAGLIDAQRRWSGGKAVFVQTGDVTDRGAGVRESLDLLMALEREAASAGGRVHVILGNHEVMNMVGDLRDVSAAAFASLGGEAAYRAAFAKDGKYGKWLRGKPIVAEIEDTVFMHAGINLDFSAESLASLNRRARREIEQWDEGVRLLTEKKLITPATPFVAVVEAARKAIEQLNAAVAAEKIPEDALRQATVLPPVANIHLSSLFHPDGPLWFRGFAMWDDTEGAARMSALLKHYRVKRFVTGHTVQPDGRIKTRFGGALFLIDTGMLAGRYYPSGRASALDVQAAGAEPLYVE
jgi:hypothetical protein